ncbi:MAG: aminoacyl-histidine dipeptidase [Candidatus Sedimenticola endophacoides]
MNQTLSDLEPRLLWQHFQQLTRTPRPSHHEEQVQALVLGFGRELGLESCRDDHGNIIIRKPATPGMEGRAGVILQGHLDMVPQADAGRGHDFTCDPIDTLIDGDWVKARGTSLGADNGIGVAAALAVLQSSGIPHGPIEALFTSNEEDGMSGAFGLAPGLLRGTILFNMDSEDEGVLCIGCAGGANVNAGLRYTEVATEADAIAFELRVSGLRGGHSGVDIHRGRGNANKLLFRLLRAAQAGCRIGVCSVEGGSLRNAIPREAMAAVVVAPERSGRLQALVREYRERFRSELRFADAGVDVVLTPCPTPPSRMASGDQERLISLVCASPHGVQRMSDAMAGLVETSNNLAMVRGTGGEARLFHLVRSSIDSAREALCGDIRSLCSLAGAASDVDGEYPGWSPDPDSVILHTLQEAYQACFGQRAEVGAVHAGLECGILGAHYPHWEMISFGPTIRYPHSPHEQVSIPSVERFWMLLLRVLASVPEGPALRP